MDKGIKPPIVPGQFSVGTKMVEEYASHRPKVGLKTAASQCAFALGISPLSTFAQVVHFIAVSPEETQGTVPAVQFGERIFRGNLINSQCHFLILKVNQSFKKPHNLWSTIGTRRFPKASRVHLVL